MSPKSTLNKTLYGIIPRRIVASVLMLLGGLILWFAPETITGVVLLIVGFTIEAFGIYFAHRTEKQNRDIY